ncbi:MAG TPA: class I adenylate-forming enzyme family protein [Acidimicrobiales bacterium]|nr:class I adenylate-forming enzyme family protein [Acidimicrobiales bacterium]
MDLLVGDVFRNAARAVPGRLAVAHDGKEMTFGQLDRRANQVARALIAIGTGYGDRIVSWSSTSLDVVPVFAAVAKLGAAFAPASPLLGEAEAADMIASAQPSLLVADDDRLDMAVRIGKQLGVPVLPIGPGGMLADAADEQPDSDVPGPEALRETDTHVLFFTSGSTGRPKGVVLSHRTNMLRTHPGAQLEPRGALVSPYPLFHMGAWTLALQQWQARDAVIFSGSDAGAICRAITQYRAARLNAIPGVWRRVLAHVAEHAVDTGTVRFADTGTSATPPELLNAIAAAFPNAQVRVFYGATESGAVASLEHADMNRKPGSCGTAAPFAEVRIDENGELWARSVVLFDGYYGNEEATDAALVDGWYRTGDLAEMDDEGYLSIIGRARDVIRTGGETVAPSEVEEVLRSEPSIADVAVVGLHDDTWGEVVCAAVVVRPGHDAPTVEALRAHCGGRLAGFKQPRRVAIVDEIPRTGGNGNVQRGVLMERLLA